VKGVVVNNDVDQAKKEVLEKLTKLRTESRDVRMQQFKQLLLQWHPDKNPTRQEMATAVFQFLQKGKVLLEIDDK